MTASKHFITLPVEGGLLVARQDGKRLFVMNDAARFIWERRAGGAVDADIPALMAQNYGIDARQAEQDFRSVLRRWQLEGLVEAPGYRRHYQIGERTFHVDYPDQATCDALLPVLGHLELAFDPRDALERGFALHRDGARYVLRSGGAEILSSDEIDEVVATLAHHALLFAFDNADWLISTHAAAVSKGRACALLPGVSGSGKSTLAAALLGRPHIRYLTEDLALLDRENLHVLPVPAPIVLKRRSWAPLEPLVAGLSSRTVHRRSDQEVRYLAPARDQIEPRRAPVAVVVFPHYEPNAEASLVRISMLEGLTRLIAAPCMISPPVTLETINRLAAWAREIPFHTLVYGSVAEAAALIDGMLVA